MVIHTEAAKEENIESSGRLVDVGEITVNKRKDTVCVVYPTFGADRSHRGDSHLHALYCYQGGETCTERITPKIASTKLRELSHLSQLTSRVYLSMYNIEESDGKMTTKEDGC